MLECGLRGVVYQQTGGCKMTSDLFGSIGGETAKVTAHLGIEVCGGDPLGQVGSDDSLPRRGVVPCRSSRGWSAGAVAVALRTSSTVPAAGIPRRGVAIPRVPTALRPGTPLPARLGPIAVRSVGPGLV